MAKPNHKAELDTLRASLRARGLTIDDIAGELAERFGYRPRAAYRLAHGWSQREAADRLNSYCASAGLDPHAKASIGGSRLSEYETWPLGGRKPSPYILTLLAAVYVTGVDSLLDAMDRQHLTAVDLHMLNDRAVGEPATSAIKIRCLATGAREMTMPYRAPHYEDSQACDDSTMIAAFMEDRLDVDVFGAAAEKLSIDYLSMSARTMMERAKRLRSYMLQSGGREEVRKKITCDGDLALVLGQLSGIMSYAALDLGDVSGAFTHARACLACGELAGSSELRAWARGTQSLIARFDGSYDLALSLVRTGMPYAGTGTSSARLACGEAQSLANLGDSEGANASLDKAAAYRESIVQPDGMAGIFTFSQAKQHYYAGSSLIWLQGKANANRAVREASRAIEIWQQEPVETRSLDDEALAQIYLATAWLQMGEIEGGIEALRPVLDLPPERRISWIVKRLDRIMEILSVKKYAGSPMAVTAREEIAAYGVG